MLHAACLAFLLAAAPGAEGPAAVVQRQMDAFNAHDLEGLMATFAEDLETLDLPGPARPGTKAELRKVYGERFARLPGLKGEVLERMVTGAFVVQRERISGRGGGMGDRVAAVVYQVEAGRIRRMWGLPGE